MTGTIKKITNNPVGSIGGAILTYWMFKKFSSINNKYLLIGLTVVGAIAGASIQSDMKAKKSVPTKETVES
jgi:hypothetical protein